MYVYCEIQCLFSTRFFGMAYVGVFRFFHFSLNVLMNTKVKNQVILLR